MILDYESFLIKFKEIYPETYLKIIDCPDDVVIGWIGEIKEHERMFTLENSEEAQRFFEHKILMYNLLVRRT